MPYLCIEFHGWRAEGIVTRYLNVNHIDSTFVRRIWWSFEFALEVCEVFLSYWLSKDLCLGIVVDVGQLLADSAGTVRRGHGVCVCGLVVLLIRDQYEISVLSSTSYGYTKVLGN